MVVAAMAEEATVVEATVAAVMEVYSSSLMYNT